MAFVSYAQNFEDVMLWRALKHVQNGVYVDVGAQHPIIDSVSKAFYEHNWRGIHIEPVPEYAELLRKDRPDETVLQIALSDTKGTLELNVIPGTGLSTAVNTYAQLHQVERGFEHKRVQVPVLTLKSALKSLAGKDVHWLKIDVEGFEKKVLKGWDSKSLRPWVMVVEATIPSSPETNYASWEPILSAADYQFVYFDGLNRFYVAKEHAELAEAFSCPPNVFDGVQLSGLASSELCRGLIVSHQARDKELSTDLNVANEHKTQMQARAELLQNEWDAAKQRVEEFSQRTGRLEGELDSERQRTVQLGAELQAARENESHLQAHAEWLQNEWHATKQRVEELSQRTGRLESELDSESHRTVQLGAELQAARENESHLQAHAEWLQNEWHATKAKIDELNQSSHHWWTVADGLNRELQSVYASKSWRITWPLRKTMLASKWVLALPARILRWALRVPKHMLKPLVVWAMCQSLASPRFKAYVLRVLSKHPKLRQRLRQFAIRTGLIAGHSMMLPVSPPYTPGETLKKLSPRAARIYADLQKAIVVRKG